MTWRFHRIVPHRPVKRGDSSLSLALDISHTPSIRLHAVIPDLWMGRPDPGLRILRMIRTDHRARAVPIILYSANVTFFALAR